MANTKPILTMDDPWYDLRQGLFGNVEPEVKLEGITMPVQVDDRGMGIYPSGELPKLFSTSLRGRTDEKNIHGESCMYLIQEDIEMLPALSASTSYGSTDKVQGNYDKAVALNKSLIKLKHDTPMESIQLNFHVSGISKACGAQISRHRVGQGHVSASRRFQSQEPKFVYPMLSYIKDEKSVETILQRIEDSYKDQMYVYNLLRDGGLAYTDSDGYTYRVDKVHKEDSRSIMPVFTATERSWWINMRALRDFFRLRLARDAEWEIRRLAQMMFNMVYPLMPSLLEDLKEKFE